MRTRRKKPLYRYEIGIPVSEYWVMQVDAHSVQDAVRRISNGDGAEQNCSLAAPVGCKKPKVFKREKIK